MNWNGGEGGGGGLLFFRGGSYNRFKAAMDFQQSAEELLTKLDTYREQLAQVEEAL